MVSDSEHLFVSSMINQLVSTDLNCGITSFHKPACVYEFLERRNVKKEVNREI